SSSSRLRQPEPDCSAGSRPSRLWKRPAMRLPEIDRGDGLTNRLLIGFISTVSGIRLPDAARVAFYHKNFFGTPMGAWTQAAMRGPSTWSVGERELMAAMVAKWNSCAFCVGAHGAGNGTAIGGYGARGLPVSTNIPGSQGSVGVPRDHDAAADGVVGRARRGSLSFRGNRRSS